MYWRLAFTGIAAVVLVSIISLGYRHYTNLVETNAVLRENDAKKDIVIGIQKNTIGTHQDTIAEWSDAQEALVSRMDEIQEVAQDAARDTERLNDLFARHDLTYLARKKPGLIERRINSGTLDTIRLLECASGAPGSDCPDPGGTSGRTTPGAES